MIRFALILALSFACCASDIVKPTSNPNHRWRWDDKTSNWVLQCWRPATKDGITAYIWQDVKEGVL